MESLTTRGKNSSAPKCKLFCHIKFWFMSAVQLKLSNLKFSYLQNLFYLIKIVDMFTKMTRSRLDLVT